MTSLMCAELHNNGQMPIVHLDYTMGLVSQLIPMAIDHGLYEKILVNLSLSVNPLGMDVS